MRNLDLGQ